MHLWTYSGRPYWMRQQVSSISYCKSVTRRGQTAVNGKRATQGTKHVTETFPAQKIAAGISNILLVCLSAKKARIREYLLKK